MELFVPSPKSFLASFEGMQLSWLCITLLMAVGAAVLVQLDCSAQLWGSGWDVRGHRGTAGIGVLGGWKDTDSACSPCLYLLLLYCLSAAARL